MSCHFSPRFYSPSRKIQIYLQGAQPYLLLCSRLVKDVFLGGCLPLALALALISCGEIS